MLLQLIKVVHAVVRHPNGADLAFLDGFDERKPGALAVGGAAVGRVQEHEVDVVEPGLLERFGDDALGGVVGDVFGADFGREEDVGARDGGALDGGGAAGFVAVGGGGVDLVM